MKKLENQTRYRCDHCGKEYKVGPACEKHEIKCSRNPENLIACLGCTFLREVEKNYEIEAPYGYMNDTRKGFYCLQKQVRMYPPKAVHSGIVDKYPETFEEDILMPKKCEEWYWADGDRIKLPEGIKEYKK